MTQTPNRKENENGSKAKCRPSINSLSKEKEKLAPSLQEHITARKERRGRKKDIIPFAKSHAMKKKEKWNGNPSKRKNGQSFSPRHETAPLTKPPKSPNPNMPRKETISKNPKMYEKAELSTFVFRTGFCSWNFHAKVHKTGNHTQKTPGRRTALQMGKI